MSADPAREGRGYKLAPPDRTGMLLGLRRSVVITMTAGVLGGVFGFSRHQPAVGLVAFGCCAALAFKRLDGGPLIEAVPNRLRWAASRSDRRRRWFAPLGMSPLGITELGVSPLGLDGELPPSLNGLVLLSAQPAAHGMVGIGPIGVVQDRRTATVSATLAVAGQHFALVDNADQDAALARWGEALAGFVREKSPVTSVRWSEWAAPAGVADHLAYIDRHANDPTAPALSAYRDLVAEAGPLATRHEVLVTVTVRLTRSAKPTAGNLDAGIATLGGQMRLFADRLRAAGLTVTGPLSAARLVKATRARLDPSAPGGLDRRAVGLGQLAGLSASAAAPMATERDWTYWRTDGSFHRALYISDWPRLMMPGDWMGGLLGWAGAVRSITVAAEPVPLRESQRAVQAQATKLESDRDQRERAGFRVGAGLRRTAEAIAQREEELVAGYPELTYAGVITVTAGTVADLDVACDDVAQVLAGLGVELRALHGRHDLAVPLSLPIGRGLVPPRRRT